METAPTLMPAPAPPIVADRSKPVIIRPPEVSAAHDFAVVGYILTLLLCVPWIIITLTIGAIGLAAYLGYLILPAVLPAYLAGLPYIGPFLLFLTFTLSPSFLIYLAFGGGGLLLILIFLALIYFGIVRSINNGRYEKARSSSLFFGVLFIIPAFFVLLSPTVFTGTIVAIIPAFFFLMTYGRLGEVIAKYGPVAIMGEAVPGAPFAGPPGPPPIPAGAPMPAQPAMGGPMQPLTGVAPRVPLCPGCGKELYYSANHRRWYCLTCDNPTGHR